MAKKLLHILMLGLNFIYTTIDLPFRIRNFYLRARRNLSLFTQDDTRSDSQSAFYERAVNNIISKKAQLRRFRRIYNYREILEHLDYKDGKKYLSEIKNKNSQILNQVNKFSVNDTFGKPRKFFYPEIGKLSPTTLRYIFVATDLYSKFNMNRIKKIVEIGAGYGGQISILNSLDLNTQNEYFIFDLPDVQILIKKYLSNMKLSSIRFLDIKEFNKIDYDLVISNYAFSELPISLQETYLEKVLMCSKNGYLIMNSGAGNKTGRSAGKLSIEYLKERIPYLEVHPESPLTGPDNYLLIWRNQTIK